MSKVVKVGLYLCNRKLSENMFKNSEYKFGEYKKIGYLCGYKKALHLVTQGQSILRLIALL